MAAPDMVPPGIRESVRQATGILADAMRRKDKALVSARLHLAEAPARPRTSHASDEALLIQYRALAQGTGRAAQAAALRVSAIERKLAAARQEAP